MWVVQQFHLLPRMQMQDCEGFCGSVSSLLRRGPNFENRIISCLVCISFDVPAMYHSVSYQFAMAQPCVCLGKGNRGVFPCCNLQFSHVVQFYSSHIFCNSTILTCCAILSCSLFLSGKRWLSTLGSPSALASQTMFRSIAA